MNKVIVDFVSKKKKRRTDGLLNSSGIAFLIFSLIGLGGKGGIPSFSTILGPYFLAIILILILILISLFLSRKKLYKQGEIAITKDSITLIRKKTDKTFLISSLINFRISINDKEGFNNFIEFETNNGSVKLFFAFKKEENYYQLKDQYD